MTTQTSNERNGTNGAKAEWHLLDVTEHGWDFDLETPIEERWEGPIGGGRCLGTYDSWGAAMKTYAEWRLAAHLIYGPGHLGITNSAHELVYSKTLLPNGEPVKDSAKKASLARVGAPKSDVARLDGALLA